MLAPKRNSIRSFWFQILLLLLLLSLLLLLLIFELSEHLHKIPWLSLIAFDTPLYKYSYDPALSIVFLKSVIKHFRHSSWCSPETPAQASVKANWFLPVSITLKVT